MNTIECCKNCIAPKRHLGCHAECPEYIGEKAAYEEKRKKAFQKKEMESAVKGVQWNGKVKHERRIGKKVV